MSNRKGAAFTIVELLVVVTIIAVLLALLTPAMDRAIYQAELSVCGAQLRAIASSVTLYASQFKRHYPDRPAIRANDERWPHQLYSKPFSPTDPRRDDRVALREYLPVTKLYNDPMHEPVEMENDDPNDWVYADYALWYGWGWFDTTGRARPRMVKLGDTFDYELNGLKYRFNLLASDQDIRWITDGWTQSSHPDRDGILYNEVHNNRPNAIDPTASDTYSEWRSPPNLGRGLLDTNYAFADLSVLRFDGVEMTDGPRGDDERMISASRFRTEYNNQRIHLPATGP